MPEQEHMDGRQPHSGLKNVTDRWEWGGDGKIEDVSLQQWAIINFKCSLVFK